MSTQVPNHKHILDFGKLGEMYADKIKAVSVDVGSNAHTHKLEFKIELDLERLIVIEVGKMFMNEEGKLAVNVSAKVKPELQELLDAFKKLEALS